MFIHFLYIFIFQGQVFSVNFFADAHREKDAGLSLPQSHFSSPMANVKSAMKNARREMDRLGSEVLNQ